MGAAPDQVKCFQECTGGVDPEQYSLDALKACIPIFETLKDEQRVKILVKLIKHGSMSVGQLVDESELSPPAISHHLKILLQAELVSYKKEGTRRIYRPKLSAALQALQHLTKVIEEGQAYLEGEQDG